MSRATAILLSVLLLNLNVEHWISVLESHVHKSCESAKHHIHSQAFDCEHVELYFATKAFLSPEAPRLPHALNYKRLKVIGPQCQYKTLSFSSNPKRGPPVLC